MRFWIVQCRYGRLVRRALGIILWLLLLGATVASAYLVNNEPSTPSPAVTTSAVMPALLSTCSRAGLADARTTLISCCLAVRRRHQSDRGSSASLSSTDIRHTIVTDGYPLRWSP